MEHKNYILPTLLEKVESYKKENGLGIEEMAEYLGLSLKQMRRLLGGEWNESVALTNQILEKCNGNIE